MHDIDGIAPEEIGTRIQKLQARLKVAEIDGALILQKADLYYFSGTLQQAHLFVPAEGRPVLMVKKSLERARSESPLDTILALKSPREMPALLKANGCTKLNRLGLEMDVLPAGLYLSFLNIFNEPRVFDVSPDIRLVRAIKSDFEIEKIRSAAQCSDRLAAAVAERIEAGMPEVELAGKIEAVARALGHQGIVRMRLWGSELFYGHLMAGPSAAVPSFLASPTGGAGTSPAVAQGPSFRKIQRHEPILVDYTFSLDGYISDHTRIFSIGPLPDDLLAAHEAMLTVQQALKAAVRPGAVSGDLYELALKTARQLGYGEYFMGTEANRVQFVGHGVGLELDEVPFLAKGQTLALAPGMTLAMEPKLILPNRGVVGIENSFLVTKTGIEQLTHFQEGVVVV
jgi:Xaa-Pro dipeptidase